jgi:hypothetical protein
MMDFWSIEESSNIPETHHSNNYQGFSTADFIFLTTALSVKKGSFVHFAQSEASSGISSAID